MIRMLALVLLAGASPSFAAAGSQPATPAATLALRITVEDAVEGALRNNPGFASARQAIQIARGRYEQARAALLPQLVANATKTWQSIPNVATAGMGLFGGGRLFAGEITDQRLTLTQALLDLRALANARAQAHQAKAAEGDVEKARVDLVTLVKTAFYDLLLSRETLAVSQATVEQVGRQLEQTRLRVTAGTAARVEELRVQVELARARSDVIRATYTGEIARETLANLMGIESATPLEATGGFLPITPLPPREELVHSAMHRRPDLEAAGARHRASRSTLRGARAGHAPVIAFTGLYDKSQGQRFPIDQEVEIKQATIGVTVPLFDGGAIEGRVREAKAQERKAGFDYESLRKAVDLDVTRAISLVEQARAVIAATETAVGSAQETLDVTEEGYKQGVRTYLEVLDAQLALAVARNSRAQAMRDYSVARAQLDQAQGLATVRTTNQ